MTSHLVVYMRFFDIGMQDIVQCECCMKEGRIDGQGFDLHHIQGRIGKDANNIRNIMLLCRKCHEKAHSTLSKSELQLIHNYVLQGNRKVYIK